MFNFKIDRSNIWFIATYQNEADINWEDLFTQEDIEQFLFGLYVRYSKSGASGLRRHHAMEYFEKNYLSEHMEKTIESLILSINRNDLDSDNIQAQEMKEIHIDEFLMIIENLQKYREAKSSKILKF